MTPTQTVLHRSIAECTLCADTFAKTRTGHSPRPVVWFDQGARILIAGQAPGARVHEAGIPFHDRSGDRLRDWMGVESATFYDRSKIAIVPMAFCFPGYSASGSDLAPPKICAEKWRETVLDHLSNIRLTLLIGGYAQKWHLGAKNAPTVTETVKNWQTHLPNVIPLPHPSWRNTAWLRKNPYFETDLIPELQRQIAKALA